MRSEGSGLFLEARGREPDLLQILTEIRQKQVPGIKHAGKGIGQFYPVGKGRTMERIIAACGNDCASCPRYTAHPYEKTEEELHHTAVLWMKIGYRDRVVPNGEISCTGCKPENWCRYHVVKCCSEREIPSCARCPEYPCDNIRECFAVTKSFEPMCRKVCTDEEFAQLKKAFFEKEKNLNAAPD